MVDDLVGREASFFISCGAELLDEIRQPKTGPNLLLIGYDLLKGRPDNRDQRASQSTATIKFGI